MAQITPTHSTLSWTIVGQGAIGLLAACRLTLAKYPVELWLRQPAAIQTHFNGQHFHFNYACTPLNAVFIPVKSYAVVDAVNSLLPHLTADAQLVLSHNGMGTIEQVLPLLQHEQGLWFLTTTHGALKQGQAVLHTGTGNSVLAPLNTAAKPQTAAVYQAMDAAIGPVKLAQNITPFLWQKLAVNAVINPLTAIYNCHNGALAQPDYQQQITQLLHEVCQVATAAGCPLHYDDVYHKVQQVITNTAANFSSMQQDIAHRRRTEIDAINGYIVRLAANYNIAVPLNSQLQQQVLQLQQHGQ